MIYNLITQTMRTAKIATRIGPYWRRATWSWLGISTSTTTWWVWLSEEETLEANVMVSRIYMEYSWKGKRTTYAYYCTTLNVLLPIRISKLWIEESPQVSKNPAEEEACYLMTWSSKNQWKKHSVRLLFSLQKFLRLLDLSLPFWHKKYLCR